MNSRVIRFTRLAVFLTAGILGLGLAITTYAQGRIPTGPPAGAGRPGNINPKRGDLTRQANEARVRSVEMKAGAEAENQKHIQTAIANMKQDFARIQVLRNDIARNLVAHKPLDYSLITEQTSEIHKRSQRLNVYMLAHAPEDRDHDNSTDLKGDEMIKALVRLCKLIDSFTENPSIKNADMVDAKEIEKAKKDKARADGDLLGIIKLSESIQKMSDSLRTPK